MIPCKAEVFRFVLTAAHCSTPEVSLEVARLGEWHVVDTSTFNNRCGGHSNKDFMLYELNQD